MPKLAVKGLFDQGLARFSTVWMGGKLAQSRLFAYLLARQIGTTSREKLFIKKTRPCFQRNSLFDFYEEDLVSLLQFSNSSFEKQQQHSHFPIFPVPHPTKSFRNSQNCFAMSLLEIVASYIHYIMSPDIIFS